MFELTDELKRPSEIEIGNRWLDYFHAIGRPAGLVQDAKTGAYTVWRAGERRVSSSSIPDIKYENEKPKSSQFLVRAVNGFEAMWREEIGRDFRRYGSESGSRHPAGRAGLF